MPSDRTMVTELGTALGMLGATDIDVALRSRTPVMHSLSPEMWDRLAQLRAGGAFDAEFHAAWSRTAGPSWPPRTACAGGCPTWWSGRAPAGHPGDEVAPIDLRVDHVYLVSCKYLSTSCSTCRRPTSSTSSWSAGGPAAGSGREKRLAGDWYAEVAPAQYKELYAEVRRAALDLDGTTVTSTAAEPRRGPPATTPPGCRGVAAGPRRRRRTHGRRRPSAATRPAPPSVLRALPAQAALLSSEQREALGAWLRPGWPADHQGALRAPVRSGGRGVGPAVGARHGRAGRQRRGDPVAAACAWAARRTSSWARRPAARCACASPPSWDWRQQFQLISITLEPQAGGQPRVAWAGHGAGQDDP